MRTVLLLAAHLGVTVGLTAGPSALSTTRRPQRTNLVTLLADDDLSLLSRRIGELKSVHRVRGVVLPEVLLPGQRMRLSMMPPALAEVLRSSNGTICTLGALLGEGDSPSLFMSCGVEAQVTELKQEFSDSGYGDATRWSATLVGGRIFERRAASAAAARPRSASAHLDSHEAQSIDGSPRVYLCARASRSMSVGSSPARRRWLDRSPPLHGCGRPDGRAMASACDSLTSSACSLGGASAT